MRPRALPYSPERRRWRFTITPFRVILLLIVAVTLGLLGYRFVAGLGAVTNLSDKWPWSFWTWWKLSAVSLAGAGYFTMFMIYFLGRERYRDVERGAFIVSMLGYLMLCAALVIDLGQWYNAYRPVYQWGYHSVMFELFWCVGSYTVVQIVEFFVIFEERVPWPFLNRVLHRIHAPLLLLACFLPIFHQSALVSLYVITKGRLDPLWWSQLLPVYAVVTFFYIGPPVVLLENVIANRTYGRPVHMRSITDMLPVTAFVMFLYLAVRLVDLTVRGVLDELLSGTLYGNFALIELGIGILLPAVMFASRDLRASKHAMVAASLLAIFGTWGFRFNVTMTGLVEAIGVGWYVPSLMESVIALGLGAAVCVAYLFIVENFPIYTEADVAACEAAMAEAKAKELAARPRPRLAALPVDQVRELERAGRH
ncbi:MAG TPA: hydrogenase [Actinomycetota bacterium]|nr:hydrogenase [Actinomycetota bacterium]